MANDDVAMKVINACGARFLNARTIGRRIVRWDVGQDDMEAWSLVLRFGPHDAIMVDMEDTDSWSFVDTRQMLKSLHSTSSNPSTIIATSTATTTATITATSERVFYSFKQIFTRVLDKVFEISPCCQARATRDGCISCRLVLGEHIARVIQNLPALTFNCSARVPRLALDIPGPMVLAPDDVRIILIVTDHTHVCVQVFHKGIFTCGVLANDLLPGFKS